MAEGRSSKERVAIVKLVEQRLDEAVALAVALLGGLDEIVPRGSRVVVKPNFVFPPTDRGITHPELIEAVVRLLVDAAPAEIAIAEGAADVYTAQGFRFQGMGRIAARYGARLIDLNLEEGVQKAVPAGLGRETVMVPRAVAECDVLVSLPVFKLWGSNPLSLSLKNLIGLYGARYYGHNKDSRRRAGDPGYALPGEVGREQSAHQPSVAQGICAMNAVVPTHLVIVDGLEGGNGKGDFIRLDTLIAGRNPVATDTVACRLAGVTASEHAQFQLAAQYGLGPCTMDRIEVVGVPLEDASFRLARLDDNVLEMPVEFCLNLLSTGELEQIQRALPLYGLADDAGTAVAGRDALRTRLAAILSSEGYYERALDACTGYARALARILVQRGGTSGSIVDVQRAFDEQHPGLYFYPSHRILMRLGLAYPVDSATRDYYLLPEGLAQALSGWEQRAASRQALAAVSA